MTKNLLIGSLVLLTACHAKTPTEVPAEQQDSRGKMMEMSASQELTNGKGRIDAQLTEVSVIVKAVDLKNRTISFVGPSGALITTDVSPEVKRLNEIKRGDKITLQYYESLAFELRAATAEEKKSPEMVEAAGKNPADLPPGIAAARAIHAIVTVKKINTAAETVTVKGPRGKLFEVKARDPKNLSKLKVGDTIAVTYTQGLAIEVAPTK